LDGHIVRLFRQGVTQPGHVQTIKGEGMPVFEREEFGDLFVEYNVVFPMELSPTLRQKLAKIFHPQENSGDRDEL
jgi:DnaJ-related protein SCJ1